MENKDFKDLLTSIDQARKIHTGKIKPGRKKPVPAPALLKVAETNPETARFICKAKGK